MRRARPSTSHGDGLLELEPLVWAVCALDGERASSLLEGLADPLRTRALAVLGCWQRTSRAQRHAALETAFRSGGVPRGTSSGGATSLRWGRQA